MIIVPQEAELLAITPSPQLLIERAGRTCYKSEDKITAGSASKFVSMLKERHHESVLEHATATFRLLTDRGITHELVRHRLASYSQESTRYVNYHKKVGMRVVEPLGLSPAQLADWGTAMEVAEVAYNTLIASGAKPEQARDVLPTCLATEIVVTANFREWAHIIKLRTSPAAHPKIQVLIGMVRDELVKHAPEIFA